jgi:hypothetical protein
MLPGSVNAEWKRFADGIPVIMAIPTDGSLVFLCTFESKNSIEQPEIGEAGVCSNNNFISGKFGNAYLAEHKNNFKVVFPKSIIPAKQGCIEFWAKLYHCSGAIQYSTFFFIAGESPTDIKKKKYWRMALTDNDGWGFGGLAARCANGSSGTGDYGHYTYESVLGDPTVWHHYAVVWSSSGVPGSPYNMQIFLDGKMHGDCLVDYVPITYNPDIFNAPEQNDFQVLWTWVPGGAVAIDNMKIWNYPKVEFKYRFHH